MTARRDHPSVLEHLQIGGLKPELVAEFKRRRQSDPSFVWAFVRWHPVPASIGGNLHCRRCQRSEPASPAWWAAHDEHGVRNLCPPCAAEEHR